MGKPVSTDVVEYAYVNYVNIQPNRKKGSVVTQAKGVPEVIVTTWEHVIRVDYDLLNADKAKVGERSKEHIIEVETLDSVENIVAKIAQALPAWVLQDKEEISGWKPSTLNTES